MIGIRKTYDMLFGDFGGTDHPEKSDPIPVVIKYETIAIPTWIKAEEELPRPGVDVFVYNGKESRICKAHLMSEKEKMDQSPIRRSVDNNYEGNWWNDPEMFFPIKEVDYWMELPQPPVI
jgi:hypothetical protein